MGRVEEVRVEGLANGGDALGTLRSGKVVFIPRGVPGDLLRVRLTREKKRWARGEILEVVEASEHRREARCEAFRRGCGGCDFWHFDYERELAWKSEAAREAMERISGVEFPAPRVVGASPVEGSRSRSTFHQRRRDQVVQVGFFEAGSHRVVGVDACPMAAEEINRGLSEVREGLALLGKAEIRVETAGGGQVVMVVDAPGGRIGAARAAVERAVARSETVKGVVVRGSGESFRVGELGVEAGEVLAAPPVEGARMEPGGFRQAHRGLNGRLVAMVRDAVGERWDRSRVVEGFCGAGNFSFALAPVVSELVGLEGAREAVEVARRLAEDGGAEHLHFEVADLFEAGAIESYLRGGEVVVLDPPRAGAVEVCRSVAASDVVGVVYVSCDPGCLGRDLRELKEGFIVESVTFVDMFPRTSHVETVVVLSRR